MTARQGDEILYEATRTWLEIGVDAAGDMRYGAWQIKDVIDLALQPLETERLRYRMHFEPGIRELTVRAQLRYFLSATKGEEVHTVEQTVRFPGRSE